MIKHVRTLKHSRGIINKRTNYFECEPKKYSTTLARLSTSAYLGRSHVGRQRSLLNRLLLMKEARVSQFLPRRETASCERPKALILKTMLAIRCHPDAFMVRLCAHHRVIIATTFSQMQHHHTRNDPIHR